MQPEWTPLQNVVAGLMGLVVVFLVGSGLVFLALLPTYIAFKRGHPNKVPIMIINLFLGLTMVGYAVALAWAFMDFPQPQPAAIPLQPSAWPPQQPVQPPAAPLRVTGTAGQSTAEQMRQWRAEQQRKRSG